MPSRIPALEVTDANRERIGVNIGSGIGGLPMIEDTHKTYMETGGPRKISPFFIPGTIINMISGNLSILLGLKGPNLAVVTACTTGLHAIGTSARMIEHNDADVMVCGGAESTVCPLAIGGSPPPRPCPPATTIPPPPAVPGTRTGTASCWARAPASWSWRSTSTPRRAAPASIANWSATARARTPIT
jgi:hypothetical protein